jgi:hypothetical protein
VFFCCSIVFLCWSAACICIVHIVSVQILCLGWINNVHITKCIVGVHLLCFLFDILTWAFMSKLPRKLQPLRTSSISIYLLIKSRKGIVFLITILMIMLFFMFLLLWNINVRLWTQFWHKETLH